MEYFSARGSIQSICEKLSYITADDSENARAIVDYLIDNKDILDSEESLTTSIDFPSFPSGVVGFMTPEYNYYINIKITTIVVLALILDITLTKGVISTVLNMCGFSSTSVVKLDERNGEKCIVKETLLIDNKIGSQNILSRFAGKCCNNDLNCRFRDGDDCTCRKEDIITIYQRLTEKNLFKKICDDCYEYQW